MDSTEIKVCLSNFENMNIRLFIPKGISEYYFDFVGHLSQVMINK